MRYRPRATNTRRDFLAAALCAGCAWPAIRRPRGSAADGETQSAQKRIEFQRELAQERALLFRELVSRYGTGVLDVVRECTIENARRRLQQLDLPERGLDAVVEILWKPAEGLLTYRIERHTTELLSLRVSECLFAGVMRQHNAPQIGFAFYCAYDYGFCEGLNPAIRFTRTRTLMEGDAFCDHTYVLEER